MVLETLTLMFRQLRANLPTTTKQLQPYIVNYAKYNQYLKLRNTYSKIYFDKKHNTRILPPLKINSRVYVEIQPHKNHWTRGVILGQLRYRKYRIRLETGSILIRNRKFIKINNRNLSGQSRNHNNYTNKTNDDRSDNHLKRVTFEPVTFMKSNIKFNALENLCNASQTSSNIPATGNQKDKLTKIKAEALRKSSRTVKTPNRLDL